MSDFIKILLRNVIQQMPVPNSQAYNAYMSNVNSSQRSILSSVASGLWSVVTLGYGSSSEAISQPNKTEASSSNQPMITFLPNLPSDTEISSSNVTDTQIDCENRLIAWQSCHVLLILSNHCTSESLSNPYRLALFHFTDTQGKFSFF